MDEMTNITVTIHQGEPEIDAIGVFQGVTFGDEWNGWATPFFTKAEGEKIVAWTKAMARELPSDSVETVRWDVDLNAFVIESPDDPHQPGEPLPNGDVVLPIDVDSMNEPLFGIGAYRWTWEVVIDN